MRGYPVVPVVRPPVNDPVIIKQFLDLGVQSLIIPMVNDAQQALLANDPLSEALNALAGQALAPDYLNRAAETITVMVQIE